MADLSRRKRVLFTAILALVAYLLAEAASFALYAGVKRQLFSFSQFAGERRALIDAGQRGGSREVGAVPTGSPPGTIVEVLHPYLGFVQDPTKTRDYSDLGFPDAAVRLYPKDPKRVVIGIFGGSFADGLSRETKHVFAEKLGKSPRYAGKEIQVLTISMGGYKQPQQFLALAYLVSLGAHFDIVVNLDGLNEVALPAVENVPKGVFPFYPRNWYGRMAAFDATMFALLRKQADLGESRRAWAEAFSRFPLRHSIAANVVWKARDRGMDKEATELTLAALRYQPAGKAENYSTRGPAFSYADEGAMYDDLVRVWKIGSLQMQRLASANGMTYVHFLQPNQYVPGSKEMGAKEREVAFLEDHPYRASVLRAYPKLREGGKDLRRQGVAFFDLTMFLADRREPLYVDSCCHLGKAGLELVAARIADEIVKLP